MNIAAKWHGNFCAFHEIWTISEFFLIVGKMDCVIY